MVDFAQNDVLSFDPSKASLTESCCSNGFKATVRCVKILELGSPAIQMRHDVFKLPWAAAGWRLSGHTWLTFDVADTMEQYQQNKGLLFSEMRNPCKQITPTF